MLGTRIDALGFGAAHPSSRASLQHQFPSEGQGSRSWLWQCKHLLYYLMPLQNYNVNSTCVYGFLFFNPFFTIFIFLGYYRHFFFFFGFSLRVRFDGEMMSPNLAVHSRVTPCDLLVLHFWGQQYKCSMSQVYKNGLQEQIFYSESCIMYLSLCTLLQCLQSFLQ